MSTPPPQSTPSSPLRDAMRSFAGPQITGEFAVPARSARYGTWGDWIADDVARGLERSGISRPWIHQAEAANALAAGNNIVLATGTGSGKSLAAWVPALSAISAARNSVRSLANYRRRPTVLYLAPTKALAADQAHHLSELVAQMETNFSIATVDGDADQPTRTWARDQADIILSNPDFVHHAMLARHERWARLWKGLDVVIIDEFHSYRGVFGSNVGLIMRRMLRIAQHYGAQPKIVFLSATSGDPQESARRFLGDAFGDILAFSDDGSPSGGRDILTLQCKEILKPDVVGTALTEQSPSKAAAGESDSKHESSGSILANDDSTAVDSSGFESSDTDISDADISDTDSSAGLTDTDVKRRSATQEAGALTSELVARGARCLTFVRSRPGTERVAEIANEALQYRAPHLEGSVAAYRGGYLPEERRELEERIRTGDLRALATTSALELGVDIAGLDAVVVTGWPGTHASFHQQIGRAGRSGERGLAVFIGRDNPLDQYMLTHGDEIVSGGSEITVFDVTNPWILPGHLASAAAEVPLTEKDIPVFSLDSTEVFAQMEDAEMLRRRPNGWYWNPALRVQPHELVDVRGGNTTVSIVNSEDGAVLGTVDAGRADTTVHPGAIYIHQGKAFEIEALENDVATVHPHREEEIRTFAREEMNVDILSVDEETELIDGAWSRGRVIVRSRVIGYDVRRLRDGMFLGMVPLTMPMREFETAGTWLTIKESATRDAGIQAADLPGALHGAEHTMISLLPVFATCDRWDLGGLSTAAHPDTGMPTIIVHDAIPGGSGCAERGYHAGRQWLAATAERLASCGCISGCPKCVQSPKCGNNNSPLSKPDALTLMELAVKNFKKADF